MEKNNAEIMHSSKKSQVYHYIYKERRTSRNEIAEALGLSLPTVAQNLKELLEEDLIEKNGYFQSTGGRKRNVYSCTSNIHIAIGAHIVKNHLRLVAVDLYGTVLKRAYITERYEHSQKYYRNFARHVNTFVKSLKISNKRILGVGIAIAALLSRDRQSVTKSALLGTDEATLADFREFLEFPCQIFHDSEAAAGAELWFSPEISDAMYLGLNNYLNGMLIANGKIHVGKEYSGGLVEHMILYPGGRQCYCGKKGCLTTYCSANVLFEDGDNEVRDEFFRKLRSGDREENRKWSEFLSDLAIAIGSLSALLDCDIILGGTLGAYMTDEDIARLQKLVRNDSIYAPSTDFIRQGHQDVDICACGAAIAYIEEFIESVG